MEKEEAKIVFIANAAIQTFAHYEVMEAAGGQWGTPRRNRYRPTSAPLQEQGWCSR